MREEKKSLLPCHLAFWVLYRVPHLPVSPAIHHRIPARGKNIDIESFRSFYACSHESCATLNIFFKTNLLFGHVQQAHWVSLALQIGPYSVERFVELSLNVCQLLKHFAGRPEQHLRSTEHQKSAGEEMFRYDVQHTLSALQSLMEGLPDSFWTPRWTCRLCNAAGRWLEQSSCTCGRAKDQIRLKVWLIHNRGVTFLSTVQFGCTENTSSNRSVTDKANQYKNLRRWLKSTFG